MRGARSLILAAAVTLALAACGSSSPASTPLNSALSYMPKDSPFVMSVVTSPNAAAVKGGQAMLGRIPYASFGQAALISRLQQIGINYDSDIRPLFGNPLVFGLEGSAGGGSQKAIAAWVTRSAGTLDSLVKKLHLPQAGTHGGAKLYQVSNLVLAIDGATLIAGDSAALVDAAIDRHANGSGMTSTAFDHDLGSLPRNGLIEVAGDIATALSASSSSAKALSIPWVSALKSYGVALTASSAGLSFQYTLDTSGKSLTSTELPLAPGSSPPGLVGGLPIQVGLRQPGESIAFALNAERESSPAQYAKDMAQMNAVERRTGVNFQRDVLGQIGNSAAIDGSRREFLVRVDVNDPAAAARTLRKLGSSALDLFSQHPGVHVSPGPAGFETVHSPGGSNVLFGLVGSEFVLGTGTPAQLRAFAAAPAAAAPGAQGAAAFRIALAPLVRLNLGGSTGTVVKQVLGSLGDITGWLSSSTSALSGNATLAVR